eukprot:s5041_g5.t1
MLCSGFDLQLLQPLEFGTRWNLVGTDRLVRLQATTPLLHVFHVVLAAYSLLCLRLEHAWISRQGIARPQQIDRQKVSGNAAYFPCMHILGPSTCCVESPAQLKSPCLCSSEPPANLESFICHGAGRSFDTQ